MKCDQCEKACNNKDCHKCEICKFKTNKKDTKMDEKTVEEIKEMLIKKLKSDFGYCGCAEGEKMIMLNSGEDNIIINIKWE